MTKLSGGKGNMPLEDYQVEFGTNTEFFTSLLPDLVFTNFFNFINDLSAANIEKKSEDKYKLTFNWQHEFKTKDPDGNPTMTSTANLLGQMRILKVNYDKGNVFCVQLSKLKGVSAHFKQMFNQIMTEGEGVFYGFDDVDKEKIFPSEMD